MLKTKQGRSLFLALITLTTLQLITTTVAVINYGLSWNALWVSLIVPGVIAALFLLILLDIIIGDWIDRGN